MVVFGQPPHCGGFSCAAARQILLRGRFGAKNSKPRSLATVFQMGFVFSSLQNDSVN